MNKEMRIQKILHKYFDFSILSLHLGLMAGTLGGCFGLMQVYLYPSSLGFILALMGVLVTALIIAYGLQANLYHRLFFGLLMALGGGVAIILGAFWGVNVFVTSVVLVIFMMALGLISPVHNLLSGTILFIACVFMLGIAYVGEKHLAIFYGLAFSGGGILLVLCCLLHGRFYHKNEVAEINLGDIKNRVTVFVFNYEAILFASCLSIAVVISYLLAVYFSFTQGYWAPMTAALITKADYIYSRQRINHRLFGTIFGSVLAALLVVFIHDKLVLAILSVPLITLIVISFMRHYGVYVCFLTALITLLFNLVDNGLSVTMSRLWDTILGISVGVIVIILHHYFRHLILLMKR